MKNNIKSTIVASVMGLVVLLFFTPKKINTKSNDLQLLIIHCTATPANKNIDKKDIIRMHTSEVNKGGRGWKVPGYSDIIKLDGTIENIVNYNADTIIQSNEITNGATGYNRIARHVVYAGGLDSITKQPCNTLNYKQDSALKLYCKTFIRIYPTARIIGHNQVANKACPCFKVPDKIKEYGISETNTIRGKLHE